MADRGDDRRPRNRLLMALAIAAVVVIFAYASQVTEIDLEEPLEPQRQANLFDLLRELARPDILTHENETRSTDLFMFMPCPPEPETAQVAAEGGQLTLEPNCASTTQQPMTLTGRGFRPNLRGGLIWHPLNSSATRVLGEFRADDSGNFQVTFTMPDIRPADEPQRIEVVEVLSRRVTGLSATTKATLDSIVETVFMALMASTIGTILAVPISFLGARNLMTGVGLPLAAAMAAVLGGLGGLLGGLWLGALMGAAADQLATPTTGAAAGLGGVVIVAGLASRLWPLAGGRADGIQGAAVRLLGYALGGAIFMLALALVSNLGAAGGAWLEERLGALDFVGNFFQVVFGLLRISLPFLGALFGLALMASLASRWAQEAVLRLPQTTAGLLTLILTFAGTTAVIFALLFAVNWICLFDICSRLPVAGLSLGPTLLIPALVGGGLAAALSAGRPPKKLFPLGALTYTLVRWLLNSLRAIEPVIMGFVLIVWVGLGPFAGVMALVLHSVADLGKLFSEQVENIAPGPLEAITATGANRLQTIVFAVVPQIIPHYIAFAFYRWDINVRLSTIIGFVGGGGIGFILFRSTNLTQYRQASVMVIAIAVVVTALDYVSSRVRRRIL
ncbi:MAG: ABC transporter permease subunit [Candidatus Promineifilaceae bacterium]